MSKRVIIELKMPAGLTMQAFRSINSLNLPGFKMDTKYEPVPISPSPEMARTLEMANEVLILVRGIVEEDKEDELKANPNVVNVWADAKIEHFQYDCDANTAKGTIGEVAKYLGCDQLWAKGVTGKGIVIGICDTGVDQSKIPAVIGGWTPNPQYPPGTDSAGHGSMCATDALGMCPEAKIFDIGIFKNAADWTGFISDAIAGYQWALNRYKKDGTPQILSNSWGMYRKSQAPDYAENPNHPFTRKAVEVMNSGIIVTFSAGNCGSVCPSSKCNADNGPGKSIWGANGHPKTITVGAANIQEQWIGYSSQGPAALDPNKPDFCAPSHFKGYTPCDNGTSAANPVCAGVIGLLRSYDPTLDQERVKEALKKTAKSLITGGWNPNSGHGMIQAEAAFKYLSSGPYIDFDGVITTAGQKLDVPTISTFPDGAEISAYNFDLWKKKIGHAQVTVRFDIKGSYPTHLPFTITWDFGDGTTSSDPWPTHTYMRAGSYNVSVTFISPDVTISKKRERYITVLPLAHYFPGPPSGWAPLKVEFGDWSKGEPTSFLWDFRDGTTSSERHPIHTYEKAGKYVPHLTVSRDGFSDTLTKVPASGGYGGSIGTGAIIVMPVADFSSSVMDGPAPLTVSFTNLSKGYPESYAWDFGDGTPISPETSPRHTYTKPGNYSVILTVKTGVGQHQKTMPISVHGPLFTITATAGPGGKISPDGSVKVTSGNDQTFTFIPDAGKAVDTLTVDGKQVSLTGMTYTFTKVTANHTIAVTFKNVPGNGTDSEKIKNEIFDLINKQRTTLGLPPLVRDPHLDKVAQYHCDTGANRGWREGSLCTKGTWSGACSHLDWDNRIPEERAVLLNYPVPVRTLTGGCTTSFVGENSFQASGYSLAELPKVAVDAWMKSPPHRRTILDSPEKNNNDTACKCNNINVSCRFSKIGIGIAKNAAGNWYINTDFV